MKKRIAAFILFSVIFMSALSGAVFAFPFSEYSADRGNLKIHLNYDQDTDNDRTLAGQGLMFRRTVEYEGLRDGRGVYSQKATVTIALPEGYFGGIEKSFLTDPENYVFGCEESGSWWNQYVTNQVKYGLSQKIESVEIRTPERGQTLDEAIQADIDYYYSDIRDGSYGSGAEDDPLIYEQTGNIRQMSDGYAVTTYKKGRTHWGMTSGGYDVSEDYEVYDCVSENWVYVRYLTLPECPQVYIKVHYRTGVSRQVLIKDAAYSIPSDSFPESGDYRSYYEKALRRNSEYAAKNTGEQILDLRSLLTVSWDAPVAAEGETTEKEAGVTQKAEETPGEDRGVSVPAAIVIGVLGAGAAVVGTAAALGSGSGDGQKNKKTYRMYVQKDFGDSIRRGGEKPVTVRARMAEADASGAERDRNDLTANIGVSVDGMTLHGVALSGRYCEAAVSVPQNNANDTANITFTYIGEGGRFNNTVVFRLADGPMLKFIDDSEGYDRPYHENCGIDAIPGDGFTYTEKFTVENAPAAPGLSDITALNTGNYGVEFELTETPAVYRMKVKNNTKADPGHDVFAKPEEERFEIRVAVEGEKEPLRGYVTVRLYPEGITVSSSEEGKKNGVKYVSVQAYEKDYVGDLDKKWQVTEIKFTLAVRGRDRAVIDPERAEYAFEKIKGGEGLGGTRADKEQSIAGKFDYRESYGMKNDRFTYDFEPNSTLCEPDDGTFFVVLLPCSAEYEGEKITADIPLRLIGKDFDPMAGWDEEYQKLKDRIEKFSLPENKDDLLEKLASLAEDPRCATKELRLTSKWIVRQYMLYWTVDSYKSQDEAKVYDVIINYLEWAKFFGDCAFSILVKMYAGPVAEAFISPTKDFLAEAIGETIACWTRGQSVDPDNFNFSKNAFAIFDNFVSDKISFANWKQAAYTLGVYFVFASVKNFYMTLREQNKFDLYGAIIHGFADMTATGIKAAAGHLFDAALKKCPRFRDKIGNWCGSFVSKNLGSSATLFDLRDVGKLTGSAVLRKYLDGLFGMGVDKLVETDVKIHDKFISSETGFEFNADGHLIVTFYFEVNGQNYECAVDVNKALSSAVTITGQLTGDGSFFAYLFDEIYGSVPFSPSVIEAPTDPPLPPPEF